MEKEKQYSLSLGVGNEAVFYGKWAMINGKFIQLRADSWHDNTRYWIPAYLQESSVLQDKLIKTLVLSNKYKKFELTKIKTILLPIAQVKDCIVCLNQEYADDEGINNLLKSIKSESYNIPYNFKWQSVDEEKLKQYSSMIQTLDLPFPEFRDELQFRGVEGINFLEESVNVFFLPVTIMDFKIEDQKYHWAVIPDNDSRILYAPLEIEADSIFSSEERFKKNTFGCLSTLCNIALGIWLVDLIWRNYQGQTRYLYLIGLVVLIYITSILCKRVINYIIDGIHENRMENLIKRRKEFLYRKGLRM